MLRREIERYRGRLIKTTGDGVLGLFDGPARAVRAGLGMAEAARRLGLDIQVGIHTGEVELRGEDIGGIAVNIAARIMKRLPPARWSFRARCVILSPARGCASASEVNTI